MHIWKTYYIKNILCMFLGNRMYIENKTRDELIELTYNIVLNNILYLV